MFLLRQQYGIDLDIALSEEQEEGPDVRGLAGWCRTAYETPQARAWAGALELMALVLVLTIAARVISSRAADRGS